MKTKMMMTTVMTTISFFIFLHRFPIKVLRAKSNLTDCMVICLADDICDDFDESSDEDDRNAATFGAIDANNQFNKELFEKNLEKKEKEEVKVLKKEK